MTLEAHTPKIPVFEKWIGTWQISVNRKALPISQLQDRYNACAPEWEQKLTRLGFPSAYRDLVRSIRPDLPEKEQETPLRVLDCGIGSGALSKAFAAEFNGPFDLSAVDISPGMLQQARAGLRQAGISCLTQMADIRRLPYETNRFDLVMCAHAIEHLADPEMAIREMLRVLKPGGTLLLVVTRKSVLGTYVHLKWRTQRLSLMKVMTWLKDGGMERTRHMKLGTGLWTQAWSQAITGRKAVRCEDDASLVGPAHLKTETRFG